MNNNDRIIFHETHLLRIINILRIFYFLTILIRMYIFNVTRYIKASQNTLEYRSNVDFN